MGLVIYSNGIVEELPKSGLVFTEEELVNMFIEYDSIESHRLPEVPNTWCVWGWIDNPPPHEYNTLATTMTGSSIYSHLVLLHDSELDPEWRATDKLILKSYEDFLKQIGEYINELTQQIAMESQKEIEESETSPSMIFLTTLGHTEDKRVLFGFDPTVQNDNFYFNGGWEQFATKIYEYLQENFDKEPIEEDKPFVIYSDTKTIVIIEDKFVDEVIAKILNLFERKENYEACSYITETKNKWYERKTLTKTDLDDAIELDLSKPGEQDPSVGPTTE